MTTAIAPEEAMRPDREALVVAALLKRGIDHPAHRHDRADGGVRHRAEQLGRRHGRHRERPAHAADDGHDHGNDAPRDTALRHDLAGEHEERNGQQRKIIEAAEHVGLHGVGRDIAGDGQHRDDRGHEQDEKNREADGQENDRQPEKDEIAHRRRLSMRSVGAASAASPAPPTDDEPHRHQERHQRVADRHHRLRDNERKIRRLAALVERREVRNDRARRRR